MHSNPTRLRFLARFNGLTKKVDLQIGNLRNKQFRNPVSSLSCYLILSVFLPNIHICRHKYNLEVQLETKCVWVSFFYIISLQIHLGFVFFFFRYFTVCHSVFSFHKNISVEVCSPPFFHIKQKEEINLS